MQQLFYNGDILTLEDSQPEAILVEDGIIVYCGSLQAAKEKTTPNCDEINLHGHCLMPSFIDPHSHITQFSNTLGLLDLNHITSIGEIGQQIEQYIDENKIEPGEMIFGFGYDHNFLKEHRHPTAKELDAVCQGHPLLIAHKSGHMGVMNTKAMEQMHLDKNTPDPAGGKYGRDENGNLTGYAEESAFIKAGNQITHPDIHKIAKQFEKAQKIYASYGITTAQDGFVKDGEWNLLHSMAEENALILDIVGYVDLEHHADLIKQNLQYRSYHNRLRLGGYKLFLDGSPQGRTAWMSKPYANSKDYCGYARYSDEQVQSMVDRALEEKTQFITHCNGDAAAQQLLDCLKGKQQNVRPVMIHAQLLRPDQLPDVKSVSMIPSFFVAHTYYWGDIHIENFGMERAKHISCAHSAMEMNIPFTFHQDTPVIVPNMLETIWCAVSRMTKNGVCLGKEECIPVKEAIYAVTKYAAYQYFEEDRKGTIKEGKLADLVVLSENPCKADPMAIKDIQVLYTFKEGRCIFDAHYDK